jgi:hypothetical protein
MEPTHEHAAQEVKAEPPTGIAVSHKRVAFWRTERPMSHKGRYDNLVVLAKGALNFLSSSWILWTRLFLSRQWTVGRGHHLDGDNAYRAQSGRGIVAWLLRGDVFNCGESRGGQMPELRN